MSSSEASMRDKDKPSPAAKATTRRFIPANCATLFRRQAKEKASFCEQKEAKKLFLLGRGRCRDNAHDPA